MLHLCLSLSEESNPSYNAELLFQLFPTLPIQPLIKVRFAAVLIAYDFHCFLDCQSYFAYGSKDFQSWLCFVCRFANVDFLFEQLPDHVDFESLVVVYTHKYTGEDEYDFEQATDIA